MPVAFFSLEMSEVELAQRFIACRARISGDKLRKGQVAQKDWPKVVRACNELEEAPLWFDDSSDLGLLDLRAKARRLHAQDQDQGGLGLIIVDYLQLMRADDLRANRVEQVGQMSRGLKILARELEVPVLAISQLSRAPEQRTPPKPMLSDLRESGSIEQDADLVAFLFREDYYRDPEDEPDGLADVIIAKHRNGPIGSPKLVFLDRFPKFADFSGHERAGRAAGRGRAAAGGQPPAPGLSSDARDPAQRTVRRAGLSARRLRRLRLDPRTRRRRPALRVPGAAAETGADPRRRLGDPAALPRRLLRPPAGQRHGARHEHPSRRQRRAELRRRSRREPRPRARGCGCWATPAPARRRWRCWSAKTALAAGRTVAIYFTPKLLTQIRQTYQATESEDAYDAFFKRLTSVDLLYIDDLGAERHTDWVVEQLYALVNERYENQRSMLVTSNAARDVEEGRKQLEDQIGSRTVSRLIEICDDPLPLFGAGPARAGARGRSVEPGTIPRSLCQELS